MSPVLRVAPVVCLLVGQQALHAQTTGPVMRDPSLTVRTVASGLELPTSMAFLGPNDFFALEKDTGKVFRFRDGVKTEVLDLGVNSASERGLLGIALHPAFPENPGVYLFWTCRAFGPPSDPYYPDESTCADFNMFAPDSSDILNVPLLGNRVDRFRWDGMQLSYEKNLITLRAFQNDGAMRPFGQLDADQPPRGNHNGGVIAFGPDGKLYIMFGDQGRRGQMQNLPFGPNGSEGKEIAITEDDQFGGPYPDDAHLTGVILRLNDDGTTPKDNPFYASASAFNEVGANIQKVFAYGIRNSFGMAFDPVTGQLWEQENGEDAFDELNLVTAGANNGWPQIMGPLSHLSEYRAIETTSLHNESFPNLQQVRWGPERIADSPKDALDRLFMLPGAHYNDPKLSWEYAIAPAAIGFNNGTGLGLAYNGHIFMGLSLPMPEGGPLMSFPLNEGRNSIARDDRESIDVVDENENFNTLVETERNIVGTGFGVVTDIEPSPSGTLYVVSLSKGEIYEVMTR